MKFGKYLIAQKETLQEPFRSNCLDYQKLKTFIKERIRPHGVHFTPDQLSTPSPSTGGCLAHSVADKLQVLQQATPLFIQELDENVKLLDTTFMQETARLQEAYQALVSSIADDPNAQGWGDVLQQIVRLEKYTFLNFTGICKILKKHDKLSGLRISEEYLAGLSGMAFYKSSGLSTLKMSVVNHVSGLSNSALPKDRDDATSSLQISAGTSSLNSPAFGPQSSQSGPTPTLFANGAPALDAASFKGGENLLPQDSSKGWFPPTSLLSSQKIVISMHGPHGTDIIGSLLENLARYDILIEDVMVSRLYHNVTCAVLAKVNTEDVQLFKDLADGASKWDAELRFDLYDQRERLPSSMDEAPYSNRVKYAATVVNENGLTAKFLSNWTLLLLKHKISVEALKRLNEGAFCVLEMKLSIPTDADLDQFRAEVFQLSSETGTDVALQQDDVFRRSKRLVVLDMDSTLIQQEVIDELAKHAGVVSEVAKITHCAMNGEIDFKESLRQRVALLKGSSVDLIDKVRQTLIFTEGARFLCRALKRLGYKLAVISGGFMPLALYVKNELGLDYAFANQLKVSNDGKTLIGETTGPVVDGERKAELLEVIAQAESIRAEQVIAIGDGANDLFMLAAAGLGIAFNAKPKVQQKAKTRINQKSLKNVLYLLGHSDRDIETLLQ